MMSIPLDILDDIRIASPCSASWASMTGTDQVRHCGGCDQKVYNISEMSRAAAAQLIAATEGRLCIRLYRRKDGTVITDDCPRGVTAKLRRKARQAAAAIAAVFGVTLTGSSACVCMGVLPIRTTDQLRDSRQTAKPTQNVNPKAKIDSFQGEYRFLSNFWRADVFFEGIMYPTAEHAYQAAKTLDMNERRRIAALPMATDAKREGRSLALRPDWESVKFEVMAACVRDKFTRSADLRAKLLATDDAVLEEGNTWGDRIWGVYEGTGENRLGKILMKVRGELRSDSAEFKGRRLQGTDGGTSRL